MGQQIRVRRSPDQFALHGRRSPSRTTCNDCPDDRGGSLYGDALSHEKDDVLDMIQLYAIVGRIRLISCGRVVKSAEKTMDGIIDAYLGPNKALHELRAMMTEGKMDFLVEFSEAARYELDVFPRMPPPGA